MAGKKNEVTLTFAGDSAQLEKTFDRVGSAAKSMSDEVSSTTHKGFEDLRESADKAEQRAMGFRDTITGVQDSVKGLGQIMSGDLSAGSFLTLGMGLGDLASGFSNLLIPALGGAGAAVKAFSLTLLASPITWIVVGIGLLVVAFVLLWNKSEAFRNFWKGLWAGIKSIAGGVVDWFEKLPGRIGGFFAKVGGFITAPFRSAFNFISDAWNGTVGRLQWSVPTWVPVIGGNSIGVPQLPHFHAGGMVPGAPGSEMLAVLQAGERVSPAGSSGAMVLEIRSSGNRVDDLLVEILAGAVKARGGNVQVVLGR